MLIRKLEFETIINNNEFDPSKLENKWLVYGHNDILYTSILNNKDKNNKFIEKDELMRIYDDIVNQSGEFKQTFYLIYNKDDSSFWTEAEKAYFCGVFFITLNYPKTEVDYECIKKFLKNLIGDKIVVYETFDNYDFILLSYGQSIQEIDKAVFRKINTCLNTLSLNSKKIYVRDFYNMYITNFQVLNSENINNSERMDIKIQLSLKQGKDFSNFNSSLKKIAKEIDPNCEIKNISGSKNLFLLLKNIDCNILFSLYQTTNSEGFFALNSESRKTYIKSTNLKFLTDLEDFYYTNINDSNINDSYSNSISQLKQLKEDIENLSNIEKYYRKEIIRLCTAMENILKNSLPDYSFLALYMGLKKFVEKLSKESHDLPISKCVPLFLEASSKIIDTSKTMQIGYYPKQEYISKETIAPSELICYYSAFVWKMSSEIINYENKNDNSKPVFTFCLNPSSEENVKITALFMDDGLINDRLLLVYIPIKYLYNYQIMLFSLCHEASHYCGEYVRSREDRTKYICDAYLLYLFDNILSNIDEQIVSKYKVDNIIEKKYVEYIRIASNKYDNLKYYSKNLKQIIQEATYNLLVDISFECRKILAFNFNKNEIIKESKTIFSLIQQLKSNSRQLLLNEKYSNKISELIELFSEAYADLFAILWLNVEIDKYNTFIMQAYGTDNILNIKSDFVILRMVSNYFANYEFNTDNEIGRISDVIVYYKEYLKQEDGKNCDIISEDFANPAILEKLIDYLKCCKSKYIEKYSDNTFMPNLQDDHIMKTIHMTNFKFREHIMDNI